MELQGFTRASEEPMTDERMALTEPLQRSGDGDFLRSVAASRAGQLIRCSTGARSIQPNESAIPVSHTATAIATAAMMTAIFKAFPTPLRVTGVEGPAYEAKLRRHCQARGTASGGNICGDRAMSGGGQTRATVTCN